MKHILIVIVLIFIQSNGAFADHFPGCPKQNHTPEECASLLESEILQKYKGIFQRNKHTLTVTCKNGKNETYVTTLGESSDTYLTYRAIKYYEKVNFALMLVGYYDSISYAMLNISNCASVDTKGYAILSPEEKRFLVYGKDIEAESSPNVLKIYLIKSGGLFLEFDAAPFEWGPSDVRWMSEKEVVFSKRLS